MNATEPSAKRVAAGAASELAASGLGGRPSLRPRGRAPEPRPQATRRHGTHLVNAEPPSLF